MPERRVSGRQRRSIGFPVLTLLLVTILFASLLWLAFEYLLSPRLPT